MKMLTNQNKRIANLFALILCVAISLMPIGSAKAFAASVSDTLAYPQNGTYVFDERGLFTNEQFNTLESEAENLANQYGMGVYFLTTSYMDGNSNPTSSQRTSYATAYYREHGLGLNKGDNTIGDGVMFVLAADSRDYVTVAYGQGSYSFSDDGIDSMEDAVTSHLSENDWYGGAQAYYNQIGSQLAYYDRHGEALVPLDAFDWAIRVFIFLGIPLLITYYLIKRDISAMKTAVERTEAHEYLQSGSLAISVANDQFVNTTLSVTPRASDSDSGGGGGGWGGGGGGDFSSSGGGKF